MFESNFLAYLLYLHSINFVSANLFCSSMEIFSHLVHKHNLCDCPDLQKSLKIYTFFKKKCCWSKTLFFPLISCFEAHPYDWMRIRSTEAWPWILPQYCLFSIINWIQSKTILDMTPVVSMLGIVLRSSFLFSLPTTHNDVVIAVSQN